MLVDRRPVIDMRGVSRVFAASPPVHALRDVDFTVERGGYASIMGPSGSGKSTLLHIAGLLDRPTTGTYRFDGNRVDALSESRLCALRSQAIGFVFQSFHLLEHRTVLENVMLAEMYRGAPRAGRRSRAFAALHRVRLQHRSNFLPNRLSGGERQRVAIARALMGRPQVLLADEPTGNLDSETGEGVLDEFGKLCAEGLAVVVVTHDPTVASRATSRFQATDGMLRRVA